MCGSASPEALCVLLSRRIPLPGHYPLLPFIVLHLLGQILGPCDAQSLGLLPFALLQPQEERCGMWRAWALGLQVPAAEHPSRGGPKAPKGAGSSARGVMLGQGGARALTRSLCVAL